MIITGKYLKKVMNDDGEIEITFSIPHYQSKWFEDIDKSKVYEISLKEKKSQRSIQQNDLLWAIISDIAEVQGYKDSWKLYLQILKKAGAKTTKIPIIEEAIPELKKAFRIVEPLYKLKIEDGELVLCECYHGSSSFNTKEMTELIETSLEWASNCEIDIRKYEVLK